MSEDKRFTYYSLANSLVCFSFVGTASAGNIGNVPELDVDSIETRKLHVFGRICSCMRMPANANRKWQKRLINYTISWYWITFNSIVAGHLYVRSMGLPAQAHHAHLNDSVALLFTVSCSHCKWQFHLMFTQIQMGCDTDATYVFRCVRTKEKTFAWTMSIVFWDQHDSLVHSSWCSMHRNYMPICTNCMHHQQ